MSEELWHWRRLAPHLEQLLEGTCAACEYTGPVDDFSVWHRDEQHQVLCHRCAEAVRPRMLEQGWQGERL